MYVNEAFLRMLTVQHDCSRAMFPASHDRDVVSIADPLPSEVVQTWHKQGAYTSHIDGCI